MSKVAFVQAVHTAIDKIIALFDGIKVEDHFEDNYDEARQICTYYEYYARAIKSKVSDEVINDTGTGDAVQVSSSTIFKMAMALLSLRDLSDRITEELEGSEGIIENVLLIVDDVMYAFGEMDVMHLKAIPDTADKMDEEEPVCKKRK